MLSFMRYKDICLENMAKKYIYDQKILYKKLITFKLTVNMNFKKFYKK